MEAKIPRLILAGTNSGCGKTTVTSALLQALVNRGLAVGAFKCGPDYIDPMFHSTIIGAKSANLDLHFFSENTIRLLLAKNGCDRDVSIIEGVMGFYDGMTMTDAQGSTYAMAQCTDTPVVLVVNARGAALSVLAVIQGFQQLYSDNHIQGVILNHCTAMTYGPLVQAIESRLGIRAYGFLPYLPDCTLESRHLGLVTAAEVENLKDKLNRLADQAERCLDIEGLLDLSQQAPALSWEPMPVSREEPVRIGVARDRAFCFYYGDSLHLLEEMGAQLVPFSPLRDPELPENLHGLYLGGGYPELYLEELSQNQSMLAAVAAAVNNGLPCIAECGGFLYLNQAIGGKPMVGVLPGTCFDGGKLIRFGYVTLEAQKDNLLCQAGDTIAAHEFHHWDCTENGSDFRAIKPSGRSWPCVIATKTLYAGFPHLHFYANPAFAKQFYAACRKEKHRHDGNHQTHGY